MPGGKLDAAEGTVCKLGAQQSANGVVVHEGCHALLDRLLEYVGISEVRFVLFDRLAFVVEDCFSAGHPAGY